jgi:hypothetical protein
LSKKNNAVALVQIDLTSGEINRQVMESRKELNSIVIPKQFRLDSFNKEILMYSISGSFERFGILSYK